MRKYAGYGLLVVCLVVSLLLAGCTATEEKILDPENPVVVTMWHCYNSQAKSVLDESILKFNETVGAEKGIIVEAYSYGEQGKLEEALYNAANKMIGAEQMPDIFTAYPDSAYRINKDAPLVDLEKYFSEEELVEYRAEFLVEGIWEGSHSPKMIPVAKSTEILYVNKTDWDKFAAETGILKDGRSIEECFATWESIMDMSEKYYRWSGGKPMMGINLNNGFMALTAAQLGEDPYQFHGEKVTFNYSREVAKKVWDICYVPHINGWYESAYYNQDGIKSGNLIAYIGSSAGSGFFPDEVTLTAEDKHPIECAVMQYPTFEGAESYKLQRGANICITASDKPIEYAAAEFLKWFTEPEQNIEFAVSTGYIPVKKEALNSMEEILKNTGEFENKQALLASINSTIESIDDQKFYAKKPFDKSYDVNTVFQNSLFEKINSDLDSMASRVEKGESQKAVISEMTGEENFDRWYEGLITTVSDFIK